MFDARSMLETIMTGQRRPGGQGGGGLADILAQLGAGQTAQNAPNAPNTQGGVAGLEDLLRNVLGNAQGQTGSGASHPSTGPGAASDAPAGDQRSGLPGFDSFNIDDLTRTLQPQTDAAPTGGSGQSTSAPGGGLGDILGELQKHIQGAGGSGTTGGAGTGGGGNLLDTLGDMFRQATDGAREGAERIGEATGARDALEKATGGRSADDLLQQLQEVIANNKLGAGAALGGLGALILGTQTGRSVAMSAAKVGALALIGGLAYKAYRNYADGQAPSDVGQVDAEPAPSGSGFEESAVSDDAAMTYLRGMLAAASADGRLSPDEFERIAANVTEAGLGAEAEEFMAREINNPATIDELARSVANDREAVQLYTAARLAIDPDTHAEQRFLADLATALNLPSDLTRHIDTSARNLST